MKGILSSHIDVGRFSWLTKHVGSAMAFVGMLFFFAVTVGADESRLDQSLLLQSRHGNSDDVSDLLQQGADPNARGKGGRTALHLAAGGAQLQVMKRLIDAGADLDAKDDTGRTPLVEAAGSPNSDAVRLLIDSGATASEEALRHAAWLNKTEAVKILLAAGVPANDSLGRAAQGGHAELVQLLLETGVDPNAGPKVSTTPLHLAALQGGLETVELLLDHNADSNALNDKRQSPLHMAVSGDADIGVVKRLVEAGARLDIANEEGVTPVRLASIRGEKTIYEWLVQENGGEEPKPDLATPRQKQTEPLAALIEDASSKDHKKRQVAQRKLVLRGEEAVTPIIEAIESGASMDPFLEVFWKIGPDAEDALPLLRSKLGDKEQVLGILMTMARTRPGIIDALAEERKQTAAAALYEFIVDPGADVMAGFALQMLVGLGEPAVDTLLRLLEHEHVGVRKSTARILRRAQFSDQRLANTLLKIVQSDPSIDVRAAAALALAAMGRHEEAARKAMLAIIKQSPPYDASTDIEGEQNAIDEHRGNPETAARALGAFGVDSIDDLTPLLSPMERPQRTAAMTALVSIGEPAIPRLVEMLGDDDQALAISASVALNRIGTPAVPALVEAIEEGDEQVVVQGASALWWIGRGAEQAIPKLLEIAGAEQHSDASRLAVTRAALKIDPSIAEHSILVASIPVLMRMLERGSFRQQREAAEALGAIGAPARAALPLLRERAKPFHAEKEAERLSRYSVRRAAKEAIAAIER